MRFIVQIFVTLTWILSAAGCAAEKINPYVKNQEEVLKKSELISLIGMRVPPEVPFKKSGKIPGWHSKGGSLYGVLMENGYIGNEAGFIIASLEKDKTKIVLDARSLPMDLLRFELKDGEVIYKKSATKLYGVELCKKNESNTEDIYFGLMRPENNKEGCLHYSRDVIKAWRVNPITNKLEDISPDGVSCFYPNAEDECKLTG